MPKQLSGKEKTFQEMPLKQLDVYGGEKKPWSLPYDYTKLRCTRDINVKPKTIKLLEKNI